MTKSLEIQGGGTPGSARLDVSVFTLCLAGCARPPSHAQKCSQSWWQLGLYPRHRSRRLVTLNHHVFDGPRAKISNPFSAPPSRRTGPREAGRVVGMGPAKRGRGSGAPWVCPEQNLEVSGRRIRFTKEICGSPGSSGTCPSLCMRVGMTHGRPTRVFALR